MTDAFRTKIQPSEPQALPEGSEPTRASEVEVEVPYFDYQTANGRPLTADYFELGDTWNDPDGGFPREISKLEAYISEKVQDGEIANSQKAVKDLLKGMEKVNNLTKEERAVIKIEILTNYVDFLTKNKEVKSNLRKYNAYS